MFSLNIIVSLALFAHVSSAYIEDRVETLEKEISGLRSSLKDGQDRLDKLTTALSATKCGFDTTENNCKIAFHAHLSTSIANVEPWKSIVFDTVVTNHGNAYSGTTGIFTAPRPGVYAFYVHILGSNRVMEVTLRKNDHNLVLLYSQGTGHYGSDDNMAVVDLAEGDRVCVLNHGDNGVAPYYVHKWFSTFTGYMLYPL
ncbi:hypothetical protein DPMN_073868 [Dreissena polymorpha]|uniref:C1q domain-containing protein n=1 Tax=Dreissena polymorpha TaxID=45954 RepID=A0A9D3YIK5_DREPO|nr:hypothetical protein DPMN_073868 [Dreissena polymorpha]